MQDMLPGQAHVMVENDGPVARLLLSHGTQNVIDLQMMDELAAALDDLERRSEISAIVVSGAGEHFSSGVDIPSHTADKAASMLERFHGAIRRLLHSSKVTVAVVKGYCLGGGAELAMVCDVVITTTAAHWGFPEIKLGCYPPVAAAGLAAIVGQKVSSDLILTGRTFDGAEAARIGLATLAVAADQLKQAAATYLNSLKVLSPAALAHAKRALYCWEAGHFDKGLARAEEIYLTNLIKTEDAQEGIRAWLEKRKPVWKGK